MLAETVDAPSVDDVNQSGMVHIAVKGLPTRAICGAHLKGEGVPPGTLVDCLICDWIKNGR